VGADAFEEGGDERDLVFGGEVLVQRFELRDECRTVVRRQRHAGEDDARAGALELLYHAREVGLRDGEGDAAQAIVAAEFEHDDGGLFGQRHEDAGEAVLRGVAADAEIDDAIGESAAVQVLLEEVGETLPGVEAEAGGDAVAVADQQGAVGGEERADQEKKAKGNDKSTANVHRNSVTKSREQGMIGGNQCEQDYISGFAS